jgi:orotidine 5'-phosphate decarboxylase subfamily 1
MLYNTAINKKSNIIFACDEYDADKIFNTITEISQYICGIKIHSDLIACATSVNKNNNNNGLLDLLIKIRSVYPELIVIDDRKLADIGKVSIEQAKMLTNELGIDALTCHALIGHNIYMHCDNLLMLAEMSCEGTLINADYVHRALDPIINRWNIFDNVSGVICQNIGVKYLRDNKCINDIITMSPGVNISTSIDTINQRYTTYLDNPMKTRELLGQFWIVGRGIYESCDRTASAKQYAELGWDHFKNY